MRREIILGVMAGLLVWGCKKQAPSAVDAGARAEAPPAGKVTVPPPPARIAAAGEAEVEPNDSAENATLIVAGKTLRGTLELHDGQADVDHFKVASPYPRGILRVEVTGVPGVDLVLEVFQQGSRQRLVRADNGRVGSGEVVPNVGVGVGDYLIVVRQPREQKASSNVPYQLTVTVRPADEGEEREPNDTRAEAKDRAVGKDLRGYLGHKGDIDWFKFLLPPRAKAQALRVALTVPPGLDYDSVEVFDENEALLKKLESAKGENVVIEGLRVEPAQKFVYVVLRAGRKFNAKKRYVLSTQLADLVGPAH